MFDRNMAQFTALLTQIVPIRRWAAISSEVNR